MSGSKWTRQTYEMVAQSIRNIARSHPQGTTTLSVYDECCGDAVVAAIVDNLSLQFKLDNAAFDSDRFKQACTMVSRRGPAFQDS